jgi:pimeloyl-ACP methyl ester carboxylesterase
MRRILTFVSAFDQTPQEAVLVAPDDAEGRVLPLVVVPHAAGWTGEMTADLWKDAPIRHGVIAVFPFGHSRRLDLRSLASRGQMLDLAALPGEIECAGLRVDSQRIYASGISMGGMEGLVLAGQHPDLLAAVVSFNGGIDLSAWDRDCAPDVAERMAFEIGGTPDELPEEYAARSPISYADAISRVPVLMYWDPNDEIVQHQEEKQSGALHRLVMEKRSDAPMTVRRHERGHTYVNPGIALKWLLTHTRP